MTLSKDNENNDLTSCKICSLVDLPCIVDSAKSRSSSRSSKRKVSSNNKEVINEKSTKWMLCSSCNEWLHPSCNGLSDKEYSKISQLLETDVEFEFRCIECCISGAVKNSRKSKDIIEVFELEVLGRIRKETNPTKKVDEEVKKTTKTRGVEKTDASKLKTTSTEEAISSTAIQRETDNNTTAVVSVSNTAVAPTSVTTSVVDEKCSTISLVIETEKGDEKKIDSTPDESKSDGDSENEDGPLNITSATVDNRNKIIIIDDIPDSSAYIDSRKILKEINIHCPLFQIEYAYRLTKGGVAIHLHSEEERDRFFDSLPAEAFSGGSKKKLNEQKWYQIFVKNVDRNIDLSEIKKKFDDENIPVHSINRIVNFRFGKPTKVLKLETDLKSCEKLAAKSFVVINNVHCPVEKRKFEPVVRCFGCQAFGHIRKNCKSQIRCERCAGPHINNNCENDEKCVNCNSCHSASSKLCENYIGRYEYLTGKHPIN